MRGLLQKTEQGWVVDYPQAFNNSRLPLHPKNEEMAESSFTAKFTKYVDFEIVKEYTDEHTNQVQSYAKLVKPQADKTDRKVKLKDYQEMAEDAWEGCDGCTEDDKHFFIKGYIAAIHRMEID
jgi:hypothetical protein